MRLEPLYRMRFRYPSEWGVDLEGKDGVESAWFFLAEGTCEGRVSGRMRGANHPRRRVDRTFMPDFQGVIETRDGATILFSTTGYGRAYPEGRRQIVATSTHLSDHETYRWLNDVVAVGTGEVRYDPAVDSSELVLDVAEIIWEPIAD